MKKQAYVPAHVSSSTTDALEDLHLSVESGSKDDGDDDSNASSIPSDADKSSTEV